MNTACFHHQRFRCFSRKIAGLLFLLSLLAVLPAFAQNEKTQTALARQYLENKEYNKAIPIFQALYESAPFDKNLYDQYLDALLKAHEGLKAENLVEYMMKIRRGDPAMLVDMGIVYESENRKRDAKETFRQAVDAADANEFKTKALAEAFEKYDKDSYAAQVFEKARERAGNPYLYATQLAMIYTRLGDTKKAVHATLDLVMTQQNILDDVKTSLAAIAQKDKKSFALIQKELDSRVQQQPNNPFWKELVSWIFIQKGDYEGAYRQLTALDKKLEENGKRLLPFAQECLKDKQYETALKSYNYILQKGTEGPYFSLAFQGKITTLLSRFENNWPASRPDLPALLQQFHAFFDQFPSYKTNDLWREYAMVQARYNDRADTAVTMLQEAIDIPGVAKDFVGRCKLDMGDYYILTGEVWDATLTYAQVDKAFKEDQLGEQARFKNARLAYYRGDFEWAQGQLSVLKASTTKLIANDALYLSVLITENTPPDSNMTPLRRFAAADLLLFRHKTRESDQLLDSLSKAFPQTPLQDDIDMLRAKIAMEEGRWGDAAAFLKTILDQYGTDVLGDDAAYKLAGIYRDHLEDKEKALFYFEKLITDYPGSTYIQEARKAYQALKDSAAPAS